MSEAIYLAISDGSDVTIARNRIGGPTYHIAILISGGGEVAVRDNAIRDSGTGLRFDTGSRAALHVEGNDVEGNGWGISIADHGGTVLVKDNTVTDNGTGVFVNGSSDIEFVDNRVCQTRRTCCWRWAPRLPMRPPTRSARPTPRRRIALTTRAGTTHRRPGSYVSRDKNPLPRSPTVHERRENPAPKR